MSDEQILGKRGRRPKAKATKKVRTIDPDGDVAAAGSTAEKEKNRGGRPNKEGSKHHKTAAAKTRHANSLKDIMQAMHGQYRSIREFLRAFFTNPQLDSAHQNFFQGGEFDEILGLMLESKYLKNEWMPEVIAKYVEEYCAVGGTRWGLIPSLGPGD